VLYDAVVFAIAGRGKELVIGGALGHPSARAGVAAGPASTPLCVSLKDPQATVSMIPTHKTRAA
jgi:hypothetical protein